VKISAAPSTKLAGIAKSAKAGGPSVVDRRYLTFSILMLCAACRAAVLLLVVARWCYSQGNIGKFKVAIGGDSADRLKCPGL
jgi:hypothetical protein